MLYVNTTRSQPGRVNLKELQEVREHHMPTPAVRFAEPGELARVAAEVARQHPHLGEETHFVLHEELHRRVQLAATPMLAVKGGQAYV